MLACGSRAASDGRGLELGQMLGGESKQRSRRFLLRPALRYRRGDQRRERGFECDFAVHFSIWIALGKDGRVNWCGLGHADESTKPEKVPAVTQASGHVSCDGDAVVGSSSALSR